VVVGAGVDGDVAQDLVVVVDAGDDGLGGREEALPVREPERGEVPGGVAEEALDVIGRVVRDARDGAEVVDPARWVPPSLGAGPSTVAKL